MYVIDDILTFYELYKATINTLDVVSGLYSSRTTSLQSLQESIQEKSVDFGEEVRVSGIFSDFVPVARDLVYKNKNPPATVFIESLPSIPFPLQDFHCGMLQKENAKYAGNTDGIPVFYEFDTSRPIHDYLTGKNVVISGRLVSLPDGWGNFLNLEAKVGIQAESIELVDQTKDEFGILFWKIVNHTENINEDEGAGLLMTVDDLWMQQMRIDEERLMIILAWGNEWRHGENDETAEEIIELYWTNMFNQELVASQSKHLRNVFGNSPVDAGWDMTDSKVTYTDWLQNQL